jgi:predicted component of type VI protein secretion system
MTDSTGSEPPVTGAKGPEELRQQIERTRSELGDTVEELAGKMDVKGRARARAADLRDKAGAMTVQLRSSAAQAGHTVHDKATHAGHKVQDRTQRAGRITQGKASQTGAELERRTEHGVPGPARPLVMAAMRHPRPVLIVGAALAAIVVVSWRYPKK